MFDGVLPALMLAWGMGKFLLPAGLLLLLRMRRRRRRSKLLKGNFVASAEGVQALQESYRWLGGVLIALGRTPPRLFVRTPLPQLQCQQANDSMRRAWALLGLPGKAPIVKKSIFWGVVHGALPSPRGRWRFASQQALDAREDIAAALTGLGHPTPQDDADELIAVQAQDEQTRKDKVMRALGVGCAVGLVVGLSTLGIRLLSMRQG